MTDVYRIFLQSVKMALLLIIVLTIIQQEIKLKKKIHYH